MNLRRALALIAVAALAAGCGGSSAAPTLSVSIASLETRAAMTGCAPSVEPLTLAVATCDYGTGSITLGTFDSNSHRDLWVLAAKTSEGGVAVQGNGWAVMTLDQQDAAALATTLGGAVS